MEDWSAVERTPLVPNIAVDVAVDTFPDYSFVSAMGRATANLNVTIELYKGGCRSNFTFANLDLPLLAQYICTLFYCSL